MKTGPGGISPIERHVYRESIAAFGEPDNSLMYDERTAVGPLALKRLLVMIWRPTATDACTMFATVGMCTREMASAGHRAELRMYVRGTMSVDAEGGVATFLANVACYPFDHGLSFDWWQVLKQPGTIPSFPRCTSVYLHGPFQDGEWDHTHCDEHIVRFLNVVPITEGERRVAVTAGWTALREDWDSHEVDIFTDRQ